MIVLTDKKKFKRITPSLLKHLSISYKGWYCPINNYVLFMDAYRGAIRSGVCGENRHVLNKWWELDELKLKPNSVCHLKQGACFCGADLGAPKAVDKDTYDWFLNNIDFKGDYERASSDINSNDVIAIIANKSAKAYTTEIHFHIGRLCNYDCSYCPPNVHDKTSPHLKLSRYKKALQLIEPHVQLAGMVKLTGGEPMMNPNLVKMADYTITTMGYEVVLATNGTGSLIKYKKLMDMGVELHVTLHEGFTIEKNVIKISDLIIYKSTNKLQSKILVKVMTKENSELYNMIRKIIPNHSIECLPIYDKTTPGKQVIEVESC